MKMFVSVAALLINSAFASCPNACSGHGTCNDKDQCTCFAEDAVGSVFLLNDDGCSQHKTEAACTGVETLTADEKNAGYTARKCKWGNLPGEDASQCLVVKEDNFQASSRYGSSLHKEWTGADCSRRTCPRGTSWTELGQEQSGKICTHATEVECSDQGLCDRATGLCSCFPGFTGSACQRTACPDDCSGHGTCRSNRDFAYDFGVAKTHQLLQNADSTERFNENYVATYMDAWDSGLLYGCLCDIGYRGPSCAQIECPSAIDPLDDKCSDEFLAKLGLSDIEHELFVENFQIQKFAATGAAGWEAAYALATTTEQSSVDNCNTAPNIADKSKCEATTSPDGVHKCIFTAGVAANPATNTCASTKAGEKCDHTDATKDKATCEKAGTECKFTAQGAVSAAVPATCVQPNPPKVTPTGEILPSGADKNRHFYQGKVYSCFGSMAGQDCSGRGICDFSTGQCQCFSGYSGTACNSIDEMS